MDRQSIGSALAIVAIGAMLIGVFTNSWWKIERGWSWAGVGLLKQRFCVDPPGRLEQCRSIKHAEYRKAFLEMSENWAAIRVKIAKVLNSPQMKRAANRAELEAALTRLDEMLGDKDNIDITVGDGSWISMGKFVYYGTFLAMILLAIGIAMTRGLSEHAALMDKIAAGACFALLTVSAAFVFRAPDYIKTAVPAYSGGHSRWLFWFGAAAGTGAGVLLAMAMKDAADSPDGLRLSDAMARGEEPAGPTAKSSPGGGRPTCPKCGSQAIFREDISCYICERCRTSV